MTSAWAEHRRKAVLFYLGTERTQDEEQHQLPHLQVETPQAAVTPHELMTNSYLHISKQQTVSLYLTNSVG